MIHLIDTHCHLTFEEYTGHIETFLYRSTKAGVTSWVTVGTNNQESQKAILLANKYENMYAAVGIHPHYAKDATSTTMAELRKLAQHKKVVAIGETGLDFYDKDSPWPDQRNLLIEHCGIAANLQLPLIVHCRKGFNQTIEILEKYSPGNRAVFHCFSGSAEQARTVLNRGYYISFTGVVTFTNARKIQKAAKVVPLDRLMVETDCPYMSPEPVRTQQPNEPAFMIHTATFLAQLKGLDLHDFAKAVTATSKAFFGLPPR
jgi:TatD DNase family protein